jgi:hypothetical protein
MNKLTRRLFGKKLLSAGALSLVEHPYLFSQIPNPEPVVDVLNSIAGYTLSAEDRQLVVKYLSTHEKNMAPLRENDLPNNLAPNYVFTSPTTKGENGEGMR